MPRSPVTRHNWRSATVINRGWFQQDYPLVKLWSTTAKVRAQRGDKTTLDSFLVEVNALASEGRLTISVDGTNESA